MSTTKFKLENVDEVLRLMKQFPFSVRKRARKAALRKTGAQIRRHLRTSAPRVSGDLRRAIKMKSLRGGTVKVGLRERFYYETLDLASKRGAPLRPWFESAMMSIAPRAGQLMITELKKSLAYEAGKIFARSNAKRIRRR